MANILECKICGGSIIPNDDKITGKCNSCGATTVIPKETTNSSKINRANYLRRANDFDKAISLFEDIVGENPDDSEAYWGLVLCKFGIEYVDDVDGSKKPTCHRTMFDSILDDPDYKAVLENSVGAVRYLYEEEAEKIDEIQKRIKAIAANEKPYDIFICYKESDELGQRTRDSLDAQEIYNRLENQGYKVFFARKTLHEKLGAEYEPIIFSALNSAKIMLVYGSEKEYFDAVWVRNEWSRFRGMLKNNSNKKIIPIFDGSKMTAYDLPNELADFQAFDKNRIGFVEDLTEGIKKILNSGKKQGSARSFEDKNVRTSNSNVANLLERAYLFLEDEDFEKADEYFERVLDEDAKNAEAYLGKLMSELKVSNKIDLENYELGANNYFKKAMSFADDSFRAELEIYEKSGRYNIALQDFESAETAQVFTSLKKDFESLGDFRDSARLIEDCKKAMNDLYDRALSEKNLKSEFGYEKCIQILEGLGDYRDCKEQIEDIEKLQIREKNKAGIICIVIVSITPIVSFVIGILSHTFLSIIVAFAVMCGTFYWHSELKKKNNGKGSGDDYFLAAKIISVVALICVLLWLKY